MLNGLKITMNAESADIYLYGEVLDDEWKNVLESWEGGTEGYVLPSVVREQLEECKGKPLNVYINSCGGQVFAGLAIANELARHDAPVTAYIDGYCASIASIIYMSASIKKMPSNAFLMIHRPMGTFSGNVDDILKGAELLETINDTMETVYSKNLRDSSQIEVVRENSKAEKWYTAKEASALFDIELIEPQFEACACAGQSFASLAKAPKELLEQKFMQKQVEDTEEAKAKKAMELINKNKTYIAVSLSNSI